MLGLFAAKSDHPLADAKEAKRILAELPGREPLAAVDDVTAWLESLMAAEGLRLDQRIALVQQLDEAAVIQARRLAREYLTTPRLSRVQERKLWQINRSYWDHLVAAYEDGLARLDRGEKGADAVKPMLGLLYARLLHAYGGQLKWDQFRYGPIDPQFWAGLGRAYLAAVQAKVAQKSVPLYAGAASPTTPEAEYLRVLVFNASSMDNLLPIEIEIAERLIVHFLGRFVFTAEARPDNVYWADAAKPLPPTRLAKLPEITPTLRFFNSAPALEAIEELRARIQKAGQLPADVNFGGQYLPRVVLPVLDHLAMCWSPKPPMRSHARHRVKSRLSVVGGLAAARARIDGGKTPNQLAEAWIVEDVSIGGMGAHLPLAANDFVRVGSLLGMQPEGGENWLIGVVRRFARETDNVGAVGIETLSKTPRAIVADYGGIATEAILLDGLVVGESARVALPATAWEERVPMFFELDGARARLMPQVLEETSPDYALGRYLVQELG